MTALVPIVAATMAPDASRAVTVATDGTLQTWVGAREDTHVAWGARTGAGPVAVASFGGAVRILWAAEGMLRLYEGTRHQRPRYEVLPAPAQVRALALAPSGNSAAVAYGDGTLRLLNLRTREFAWIVTTGVPSPLAVALAPHGAVAAAFPDGAIRFHARETGTSDIAGTGPPVRVLAITPHGDVLVTVDADGILRRWKMYGRAQPEAFPLRTGITATAVDGTGDKVLVGTDDGIVRLHDLAGGSAVEYGN